MDIRDLKRSMRRDSLTMLLVFEIVISDFDFVRGCEIWVAIQGERFGKVEATGGQTECCAGLAPDDDHLFECDICWWVKNEFFGILVDDDEGLTFELDCDSTARFWRWIDEIVVSFYSLVGLIPDQLVR